MGVVDALSGAFGGLGDRIESVRMSMAPSVEVSPGSTLSGRETRALIEKLSRFTPADLHRTQPNLRAVVDFRARNVAQLGLHVFRPVEQGRERDRTSAAARVLANPNPAQTGYQLMYSLVADMDLYDEAFWVVLNAPGILSIRPLPVADVVERHGSEWNGTLSVDVLLDGKTVRIPAENLIHFRGYSPAYGHKGSSPIEALRDTLTEQVAAQAYRLSVWRNGGLISSYISRPSGAPGWSKEALARFKQDMREFRSGGVQSGGMPLLEDGMKIEAGALNSKEQQYVEAAQLSLATVARTYHVNPAMLGETGGVTYANMREFRKSLYGETLGPLLRMVEDHLNTRLLPMLGVEDGSYFEFNVKEKLRGSFEEEADVLSTATGSGAWMTVNEARATQNLQPVPNGDQVLQPLNMAALGATDTPDGDPAGGKAATVEAKSALVSVKAEPEETQPARIQDLIESHSRRQQAAVTAALNSKADTPWWDGDRWDRELSADLLTLSKVVTAQIGAKTAAQLGYEGDYDLQATVAFLTAVAETRAHMLNEGTRQALEAVVEGTAPEGKTPEDVFTELRESRGAMWGASIAAALAGFAAVEAGRQVHRSGRDTTKTWVVRSKNPRHTHAAMNGQTVGINEKFSNGSDWPGDSKSLPVSEVANCQCSVEITTEDPS
ncbi:phage portal protein [Kocuria tytonis]|uniref:Phage portal protein n=1 Tax=Kocuria tytonis TaxID=2054280 RepID=A0A495A863_9MICC|nr:phage portal protein [Kocuria tytonis]RKQ36211.1 phage portal protein [Kocuria tytonis]